MKLAGTVLCLVQEEYQGEKSTNALIAEPGEPVVRVLLKVEPLEVKVGDSVVVSVRRWLRADGNDCRVAGTVAKVKA